MTDSPLARHVFRAVWFVAVPIGAALALVWALSRPTGGDGAGLFDAVRAFARDQPVPLVILSFTLFELLLWSQRHALPLAGALDVGGRRDVPLGLRRRFEEAGHLLDECERITGRQRVSVERTLGADQQAELREAMEALRGSLDAVPFEADRLRATHARLDAKASELLSRWRKSELREYTESIGAAVLVALLLRAFVIEAFKIPSVSMVPTLQVGDHIFVNKLSYGPMVPFVGKRILPRMPPAHGDVMVFQYPENPEQDFIKRVIALPGDHLEALDGRPIINGWRPPECRVGTYRYNTGEGMFGEHVGELVVEYLGAEAFLTFYESSRGDDAPSTRHACTDDDQCEAGLACRARLCGSVQGPYQVKPGEVWVMGDNRNNSHDSRGWWGGRGGGVPFDMIKGRALGVWLSFLPAGGFAWDRIGLDVMGRPKLPPAMAALQPAVDRCFAERPPESATRVPRPR